MPIRNASPSRGTATARMALIAALALAPLGCAPDGPHPATEDASLEVPLRAVTGEEPGLGAMASFALDYLLHAHVTEAELEAVTRRYFIDAVFVPYAYFGPGRPAPPEDVRAWVERGEPLTREDREEIERLGLAICRPGPAIEVNCAAAEADFRHLALGLGDVRRTDETGWSFDYGFIVLAPSGVSTGAARVAIRLQDDAWVLTSAQTLWVDH